MKFSYVQNNWHMQMLQYGQQGLHDIHSDRSKELSPIPFSFIHFLWTRGED